MTESTLFDLRGKIALVIGSSRGIGEAAARALAGYGALVIVASRDGTACELVAASIRAGGGKAEARTCHMGQLEQIEALYAAIEQTHGRVDVVVNNAGIMPYFGPIADTDLRAFDKTIDVNVRGYFYSCVHAVRLMARHGGGSIVNVASINAVQPGALLGVYSVSKAAVVSMTQAFAKECARDGIRVNALLPGPTATRLAAPLMNDPVAMGQLLPRVPMGRMGLPEEMAGAIVYFASSASSFTTGACLPVDGGVLLG